MALERCGPDDFDAGVAEIDPKEAFKLLQELEPEDAAASISKAIWRTASRLMVSISQTGLRSMKPRTCSRRIGTRREPNFVT